MPTSVTALAAQAATAVHELAHRTRPAITALHIHQLGATTGALADLVAALGQTLRQLQGYLTVSDGQPGHDPATAADTARASLDQASAIAAYLAATLDTAHQALGDLAETTENKAGGSIFNRR